MKAKAGKRGAIRRAMDRAHVILEALAGRASASTTTSADAFVERIAIADLYEISAAKLALCYSSSPAVLAFARKMVNDHTTSTHHRQAALEMSETRGVAAPSNELDRRHLKMLEHLQKVTSGRFEARYLDQQILAHEETLALLIAYRDRGDNAQLRSYASAIAPVVKRHLRLAKQLRAY